MIHIFCWMIFIVYELSMVYAVLGKLERPYIYLIFYPINISYFYSCLTILNKVSTFSKVKILKVIGAFLILITLYLLIKGTVDYFLEDHRPFEHNPVVYFQGFYRGNLSRGIYFTLLAILYWSAGHISFFKRQAAESERAQLLAQKENAELETALARAQSAFRQQQLNPHMLFNTLNFIYNNVQRHSDDAARCVWLLSEIMRFSLEAAGSEGKVVLESEAAQIEHLLEINHYRFPYPLYVDVDMKGNFRRFRIIPLILLTLTENVFKHGNLTEVQHPATIRLEIDDQGRLLFFTSNKKKEKTAYQRIQQIGLQNIRIRLDAEYKANYKLEINEPGDYFELELIMNL